MSALEITVEEVQHEGKLTMLGDVEETLTEVLIDEGAIIDDAGELFKDVFGGGICIIVNDTEVSNGFVSVDLVVERRPGIEADIDVSGVMELGEICSTIGLAPGMEEDVDEAICIGGGGMVSDSCKGVEVV